MLAATNRANTYFQQSQYLMQQQAGYPPEIMEQFMTPQAFQQAGLRRKRKDVKAHL